MFQPARHFVCALVVGAIMIAISISTVVVTISLSTVVSAAVLFAPIVDKGAIRRPAVLSDSRLMGCSLGRVQEQQTTGDKR